MNKIRDHYVDCFKGFMILWVIHIHTVFWTGYAYLPEVVRQVTLLIDVPIFFFISGYVTRPDSFLPTVWRTAKQFLRIYYHYFIISCILLGLLLLINILLSQWELIRGVSYLGSILRMTPYGGVWDYLRVYNGSLWFLRDYLSVLVFVPVLLGIRQIFRIKYNMLVFALLFTALFPKEFSDVSHMFSSYGNTSFYLVFFMIGVIFREQEDYLDVQGVAVSLAVTICLCLVIYNFDNGKVNIQNYKFPPSTQYLILSLPLIHLFILLKYFFRQRSAAFQGRISLFLRWCGVNIFYIYLFQGAICSLPYFFVYDLSRVLPPLLTYLILLAFNVVFTLLASFVYQFIHGRGMTLVKLLAGRAWQRSKNPV